MLPKPMIPIVFPESSAPLNSFFSHCPAFIVASALGIWRRSDIVSAMANSATVVELAVGVLSTKMPLAVAVGRSMLSTPVPARPMTFSFPGFSRTFGVTFVLLRMMRAS